MKVAFHTLGCKVNSYETQAVLEQFRKAGWEIVDFADAADVYIINTCSVTGMAEHKSRQMLHRAKRLSPGSVIVATGCYAQRVQDELLKDSAIDLVIGNNNKSRIREIVDEFLENRPGVEVRPAVVSDLTHCTLYEEQSITSLGENVRAYVKIQDGCNRFCSYCIIPYVRGRSRCRREEDIISEIRSLAENGYKEIVLTGIDISMYEDMAGLIEKASEVDGIKRIRLGSLEAGVITEDFIKRAASCSKLCPHFHLSLQSGCNETLKRMNRHYTNEEFYEKVKLLRENFPSCAITTDVIVGFPGETDEEFEESMEFIRKCSFARGHVFKYSRREGTRADNMPGQVPEAVKNERSARLIAQMDEMSLKFEEALIGQVRPVLAEEEIILKDGRRIQVGYTPEYVRAGFESSEDHINTVVNVSLQEFSKAFGERLLLGII